MCARETFDRKNKKMTPNNQALDDKAMRQRTDESCQKVTKGCKDILDACIALANAAKNPYQKRILLEGT